VIHAPQVWVASLAFPLVAGMFRALGAEWCVAILITLTLYLAAGCASALAVLAVHFL